MKAKLKLIKIERKDMAGLIALLGVAAILSVVVFATPNDIPVGEMAYQKLWLGRMVFVFVVCCVCSFCLNRKQYLSFSSIVTWVLIALGGIEAIWGLRQIYGLAVSNHSLYALTGSFYNPGPYSGYLAMIFPLCLYEWLNLREKMERTWVEQGEYYMALGVMLLILCVLPAGMSRSAWIAAIISGLWVYGMYASWGSKLKEIRKRYKRKVGLVCIAGGVIIIMIGYALFQLKATSANGRLFMWKVSALTIAESPVIGHGTGNFVSAYGRAQEDYFSNGEYSETEELVAGSPEYAFNEYLQVAVEYGIPFLLVVSLVIGFCLWKGSSEERIGLCGSVISVLVFAFSSYPMQIPGFAVTFYFLLAACVIGRSKIILLFFVSLMILLGAYYWKNNQYDACKDWHRGKMLYNIGAYQSAKEDYEKLYPELTNRGAFLFEYGYSLHKLKEYDNSTRILEEAMTHCNDPMILNIIGKNYQATGDYEKAEEYLIRSTHRLPGRIYPYYLLAKLYAEPKYRHPEKLKYAAEIVLTKEPKVQSTAVKEMREEVKKLLK
ncbi:O-antigen ligase family protein [uncultured Bacteroides sp.]|uniref:O-antigen ligase family protein n=1 Tax=uncultured Bacteroides sp. TaxID=162156 RepID=UPI00258C4D86|nr:O-antigen ligase family protein [uncultured Bacteroides sp.]